jgi:hypothetical protein
MSKRLFAVIGFVLAVAVIGLIPVFAQEDPACPGAPLPQLTIGASARVLPGDPNNVRDTPSRSGVLVGSIPGGEIFDVLDGPVCADGLNWWQIDYEAVSGWTVEGSGGEYWVEPYEAPASGETAVPPTPTPEPISEPAADFDFPIEAVNQIAVGTQVRVINDDPASDTITLTIRAEPGRNGAPLAQALEGDLLTVVGGPEEADSLRWWQVETVRGTTGWVIEGLVNAERGRDGVYERTLLAICPADGDRIAYRLDDYIVTSSPEGSDLCVLDLINVPVHEYQNYQNLGFDNQLAISPDGQYLLYVSSEWYYDNSDTEQTNTLYRLKLDGSERLTLTHDLEVSWAAWSPNGERIAIASGRQPIGIMQADGSGFNAATPPDYIFRRWVAWLPDNETIVYSERTDNQREYIFYSVNLAEGGLREIFRTPAVNLGRAYKISLSSDGTMLKISDAYGSLLNETYANTPVGEQQDEFTSHPWTLVIDLETGEPILETEDFSYYMWTPDDSALILPFYDVGESLQVLPLNGDEPYEVTYTGDPVPVSWRFLRWETATVFLMYQGYGVDADSDHIELTDWGLWAVNIETGEVERRM